MRFTIGLGTGNAEHLETLRLCDGPNCMEELGRHEPDDVRFCLHCLRRQDEVAAEQAEMAALAAEEQG